VDMGRTRLFCSSNHLGSSSQGGKLGRTWVDIGPLVQQLTILLWGKWLARHVLKHRQQQNEGTLRY
jgi:hypothetical protein